MTHQEKFSSLGTTANELVAPGKGILAADESLPSIEKRFAKINLESTEENRRAYREMLFTTKGIEEFISGIILFDETLRQSNADGKPFPQLLAERGIIPGIKVDQGLEDMQFSSVNPEEKVTRGLDGLAERLAEYKGLGARFAKWRAVFTISESTPSLGAIIENAKRLAKYAAACQQAGIVPIVEPEVLMDGGHSIEECQKVTTEVLHRVFAELYEEKVELEGMLLKPNMVISGKGATEQASKEVIAGLTVITFLRVVPAAVPGIVFLSGGQGEVEATVNLNEMNKGVKHPWELSFSYGRALQDSALKTWQGKSENVPAAQQAFFHRAKMNSLARAGNYTPKEESQ